MANRRQEVLRGIWNGSVLYQNVPLELRDDAKITLAAIARASHCPNAFARLAESVPPRLTGNKAFVLAVMKTGVCFFSYASRELKADREVVMAAVRKRGWTLRHASEELRGDREIVLVAVHNYGFALEHASEELRCDREIVLAAVHQSGQALRYASHELRGDREIVLAAVRDDGYTLQYASHELRGDREIVLAAVREDGYALQYASRELRGDREIVFAAVHETWTAFGYASREARGDREIVLAAVHENGYTLKYASRELHGDREIVLAALHNAEYHGIDSCVTDNLRNEPVVAGAIIRADGELGRRSEIMGRLGNALLAVRALPEADFDSIVDEASVVEFSRWWERRVWHKIWLALQLEPPGMQGTGRLLVKLSGLPLELRQAKELRRCAPVIGAVLSSFPDRDWRDFESYVYPAYLDEFQGLSDGDY